MTTILIRNKTHFKEKQIVKHPKHGVGYIRALCFGNMVVVVVFEKNWLSNLINVDTQI